MKNLIRTLRRDAQDAMNRKGMTVGLPKARVDAGKLLGLCERAELLIEENERLKPVSKASSDVLAERQRQIEAEGHDHEHDDQKASGELALAAACYTLHSVARENGHEQNAVPSPWPWPPHWWKPTNTRRDLVKAAALIIAEIERIDRVGE